MMVAIQQVSLIKSYKIISSKIRKLVNAKNRLRVAPI